MVGTSEASGREIIGVVGAGAMGRGIAQLALQAGHAVRLYDQSPEAMAEAQQQINGLLARAVAKGRLSEAQQEAALAGLSLVETLADLAPCGVIVEAIVEDLEVKRSLLRTLEQGVSATCILATNTSSLSVTAIAAGCQYPERVAGFHFFNPAPLMKVVEVVAGVLSADSVLDRLEALTRGFGHTPIRCADTPGFVVNHAGRGYGTEALRIVQEGVASIAVIDGILRDAAGFRMGPFQLLDLTGLDVSHPVMESIYHQYYEEPRYRPSPIARQRLAAGLLGRKSRRGFYGYDAQGQPEPLAERPAVPPLSPDLPVWISRADPAGHEALRQVLTAAGLSLEDGERPSAQALCLVTPLGDDATTCALAQSLDPRRVVAVDTLCGLAGRRTLMKTPVTETPWLHQAEAVLAADGVPCEVINDSAGSICQRVLATIVNIACDMAQQRIAQPADIDRAVQLGLGYPRGPLAWGDSLGGARILQILEAMHRFSGDPRYRPSPWLKRRALLGQSLLLVEDL